MQALTTVQQSAETWEAHAQDSLQQLDQLKSLLEESAFWQSHTDALNADDRAANNSQGDPTMPNGTFQPQDSHVTEGNEQMVVLTSLHCTQFEKSHRVQRRQALHESIWMHKPSKVLLAPYRMPDSTCITQVWCINVKGHCLDTVVNVQSLQLVQS